MNWRKQTIVKPFGEKTQELPDEYSPSVLKNGLGFGMAWLTKQLGFEVFEIANTNSMLPLFDYDHLLYCEVLKDDSVLKLHDVCIYEDLERGKWIVHRITKIDYVSDRFYFKGDNNLFGDGWIPRERIKWRVAVISYTR